MQRIKSPPPEHDEFEIISLRTSRSNLDKHVPIEIENFREGKDISKAISELIESTIIDLENLSDINKLTVSFSKTGERGKRKTVIIKENEDGTLILLLNGKDLKDDERSDFSNIFSQRFGIELNIPLDPSNLIPTQKSIFHYLLSKGSIPNPSDFHRKSIEFLRQKGVLTVKKQYTLRCSNCEHIMYSSNIDDKCRDCHSLTYMVNNSFELEISEKGIRKFILQLIKQSTKFTYKTPRNIKINNTPFKFHEIEIEGKPVFVYFNFGRVTKILLDYLVRSGLPILFINVTKVVNTKDIEKDLFQQVQLNEILDNENESLNDIESKVETLRAYSLDRIAINARRSFEKMRKGFSNLSENFYTSKDFEADVFNILKQLFPSAYKAGTKSVPEGFVGLEYKNQQNHKCVFEWDCKLTYQENYKLTKAEMDKDLEIHSQYP